VTTVVVWMVPNKPAVPLSVVIGGDVAVDHPPAPAAARRATPEDQRYAGAMGRAPIALRPRRGVGLGAARSIWPRRLGTMARTG
jgi:hypothetical protein